MTAGLILVVETTGARITPGAECTLGRAPENTLSFTNDNTISRRHASIRRTRSGYLLTDLESRNGTFLERPGGRMRVSEHAIGPGDVILAGAQRLVVQEHPPDEAGRTGVVDPNLPRLPDATRVADATPDLGALAEPPPVRRRRRRWWRRLL